MKTIATNDLANVSGGTLSSSNGPTIFNPQAPRPPGLEDLMRPRPERPLLLPLMSPGGPRPRPDNAGSLDLPSRNDLA